ncbi:MAG: TetR/AcrR family transcriptional regulator [Ilumatobacter sp.]|uniref:TetR/AcrR family transcriptional regulator n=1 Tax=Ilumatobacter sp. TaxID=1967498 RepID=UPI00391D1A5E
MTTPSRRPTKSTPPSASFPPAPAPNPSGTERDATDGRIALRLRNRQRVVDALIALVEEGVASPTLAQMIERSGVSERSIFRYFDDLGDLSLEAIRVAMLEAQPLAAIDDAGKGDLDHRIKQLVTSRIRVVAKVQPFGRLARQRLHHVPEIAVGLDNVIASLRDIVTTQLAPELREMTAAQRRRVVDTIVALLSFEGHDVLTRQLGNSDRAVARLWTDAIRALVTAP